MSTIEQDGSVIVEGETIGKLSGFRFVAKGGENENSSALKAAAAKTVGDEIEARATSLVAMPDQELNLTAQGRIVWQEAEIAMLSAGDTVLKPKLTLLADDYLQSSDRAAVLFRLQKFLDRHIATVLEPLQNMAEDESIEGLARGIAFQITENLGVMARLKMVDDLKNLDQAARSTLRKHGVRFGAYHVFVPVLLKPAATQLRLLLWGLWQEKHEKLDLAKLPEVPGQGLTSAVIEKSAPEAFYLIAGFKVCGTRIVRIDMLERLGDMIRQRVFWRPVSDVQQRPEGSIEGGGFSVIADMMSLVGCSGDEFSQILIALGYKSEKRPLPKPPVEEVEVSTETTPVEATLVEAKPSDAEEKPAGTEEKSVATEETSEPQEPAEPQFLEVWWPNNTGPFRSNKPANKPVSNTGKAKAKNADHKPRQKSGKPKQKFNKKPPRTINPEDSPFGALAALKGSLKK